MNNNQIENIKNNLNSLMKDCQNVRTIINQLEEQQKQILLSYHLQLKIDNNINLIHYYNYQIMMNQKQK